MTGISEDCSYLERKFLIFWKFDFNFWLSIKYEFTNYCLIYYSAPWSSNTGSSKQSKGQLRPRANRPYQLRLTDRATPCSVKTATSQLSSTSTRSQTPKDPIDWGSQTSLTIKSLMYRSCLHLHSNCPKSLSSSPPIQVWTPPSKTKTVSLTRVLRINKTRTEQRTLSFLSQRRKIRDTLYHRRELLDRDLLANRLVEAWILLQEELPGRSAVSPRLRQRPQRGKEPRSRQGWSAISLSLKLRLPKDKELRSNQP